MPDGSGVDIVWAEDSAGDRFLIQTVLDELRPPARVAFAVDGTAALDLVARYRPRLVVLDLKLPRESGLAVLERIRASPGLAATRVAIFSASAKPGDIARARALGALGFFQKPIDFKAFRQAVTTLAADVGPASGRQPLSYGGRHHVLFWDSDADLVDAVARFLGDAHARGDGLLVLATADHLAELRRRVSVDDAVWMDAGQVYRAIRTAGRADPERFAALFGQALEAASRSGRRPVACFGELVAILQGNGEADSALAIEAIGQGAAAQDPASLSILCAYPVHAYAEAEDMGATCLVHTSHSFSRGLSTPMGTPA